MSSEQRMEKDMMSDLIDRRERMRRLVLVAAAFGCACATLSGTLAALA